MSENYRHQGLSEGPRRYSLTWYDTDDSGRLLSAGIYFVKLEAGQSRSVKKAVLVR